MEKLELETYLNWKNIESTCESCHQSALWKFRALPDTYWLTCQHCGFIRHYDREFVDDDWAKNEEVILSDE
ncbi:hypothetical protein E5Q53_00820 [Haemophilus parahaemolyticus]|uniref:Uncharacterized protein n=1 Tax=Haemophilus parahaemolyticus TaxID=735 RepID=A0AAE6JQ18_HAEPH|nr:hypothetical protein [Haemophilus parahaemolyticus]OOR97733.1 hypothetical protein B0185_02735 [Haemophilus parahaemolyticus]QEN10116.1 hypothetical protein E5Q53_00820 [Haemophilus parahaemolyticus]QRP13102.1 hypothetical protein I6J29_02815 [Haemophilus parahaemolyticus]DAY09034.1 MAG TPA: Transcription initiation factor IIE, alpha FINGER, Transcription [Caudoviricetes sp.]